MSVNEILKNIYQLPIEQQKQLAMILANNINDPYFYERKESLSKLLANIENGSETLYNFNTEIDILLEELKV